MKAVKKDGETLQDVSEELKDDREVVAAAVKSSGCALRYASQRSGQMNMGLL